MTITTIPCPECDGSGVALVTVRVSGEAYDADQMEVDCDYCGGEGEFETDEEEEDDYDNLD